MSLFTSKEKWRAPDKSMMKYSKMTEPKDFHSSVFQAIPVFTESQNFVASNNDRTRLQSLSHKMLNNSNLNSKYTGGPDNSLFMGTPNFEDQSAKFSITKICYISLESSESPDSKYVILKIIERTFWEGSLNRAQPN